MESIPTAADLENRAATISDPSIELEARIQAATELLENVDAVREADAVRVIPHLVPNLLQLLHTSEVQYKKDTPEFRFRRLVIETFSRVACSDAARQQTALIVRGLFNIISQDNEDNAVTAGKTLQEVTRLHRIINDQLFAELAELMRKVLANMPGLVNEILSADSVVIDSNLNPNIVLPSNRSFKVITEVVMAVITWFRISRNYTRNTPSTLNPMDVIRIGLEVLPLQSPAQQKAREDAEAMGQVFTGMTREVVNPRAYVDFIAAQVKVITMVVFLIHPMQEKPDIGAVMVSACVRMLQDCPIHAIIPRKDLIVPLRTMCMGPYRPHVLAHVDKILDEKVLLGSAVGVQETLRHFVHGAIAECIHHTRNDLSAVQLQRICNFYAKLMVDPSVGINVHILCGKVIFHILENVIAKDTPKGATTVISAVFEAAVERTSALPLMVDDLIMRTDASKKSTVEESDVYVIERQRPIGAASYVAERGEDALREFQNLFRTLLNGFRISMKCLKSFGGDLPDGSMITRMFDACLPSLRLFGELSTPTGSPAPETFEPLCHALAEVEPLVFANLWASRVDHFFKAALKQGSLISVYVQLLLREATMPATMSVVLRYLVDKLPELAEEDEATAVMTLRFYKASFGCLTGPHSQAAEHALKGYIGRIIMESFPSAAKASNPLNYYNLLRLLFRAIAAGGGRFERLYGEVLPLLPEMLESLNRHLSVAEGQARLLLIELCLTVPLRLTHLLPHLSYLMRPLVLALRSTPDLVGQGLRTLELCIDNLTADFLDPTLAPVLRDLMEALHNQLKPLPANHHHAHTTIRILGKLGGRNRRLLYHDPQFKFRDYSDPASLTVSLAGNIRQISLEALVPVALRVLQQPGSTLCSQAFSYLESCVTLLIAQVMAVPLKPSVVLTNFQGILTQNQLETFVTSLQGIFFAIHNSEIEAQAVPFVKDVSRHVLSTEIRVSLGKDSTSRRYTPSPLLTAYLDAMVQAIDHTDDDKSRRSLEIIVEVVKDLIVMDHEVGVTKQDVVPTLNHIVSRLTALCLEDAWNSKAVACTGIKALINLSSTGIRWVYEREIDLVRTLVHVLKDLPVDPPRNVEDVIDVLKLVLQVSSEESVFYDEPVEQKEGKRAHLIGVLFTEMASSKPFVRQAAQACIGLLANITSRPTTELLMPHRDRVLANLFSKPLRALPHAIQIGHIHAIRFAVGLDPPLIDPNDELLRLLHEALAMADSDEAVSQNRPRQAVLDTVKLRVACIQLLTASMPLTDFFNRQPTTRQKVTGVYFKSLYSTYTEIKEVAHEGLRMVLAHQSKLPRELLQQGLRPILMNLADPKRLSIPGLEGLGRLLELLTSYFKVEIGHKLLDHFRSVADPQSLSLDSRIAWADNDSIIKLARLANIFHLLPPAANMFLEKFVDVIVHTEAQMHFWGQNPFSEPLARFLDRYPVDSVELLLRNLQSSRHVRAFRSALQAGLIPSVQVELIACTRAWIPACLYSEDQHLALHGLQLIADLTDLRPLWMLEHEEVIEAVLHNWRNYSSLESSDLDFVSMIARKTEVMITILLRVIENSTRIDLIFELIAIYTRDVGLDLTRVTQCLYRHVAGNVSLIFRRNLLVRFISLLEPHSSGSGTPPVLHNILRFLVTPILLIHSQSAQPGDLVDSEFIACCHRLIWQPLSQNPTHGGFDGRLIVELLHMTTVLVQRYTTLLPDRKSDIFRCTWNFISNDDSIVKQTAYLLAARFFEAFPAPEKFIIRTWTGLLLPPQVEGRGGFRQALDILAPVLSRTGKEDGATFSQWARTTRRLLAEEGNGMAQIITIYQLIVRHPTLFYSSRGLFIPHMVNSLNKLATPGTGGMDSRSLSLDILQVILQWEDTSAGSPEASGWVTPLAFRETMTSYLMKFAIAPDPNNRGPQRAIALLRSMMAHESFKEVTLQLHYFSRTLDQNDVTNEMEAVARVLQVAVNEKDDQWVITNAMALERLIRKGMSSDLPNLHDALHPVFHRLIRLFPLHKEDEDASALSEFHAFVYATIHEGLRSNEKLTQSSTTLRGAILMLKSVVDITPERMEPFAAGLVRLCARLTKEHIQTLPSAPFFEAGARVIKAMLEIFQTSISFLGEQRKILWSCLGTLAERSQSPFLCRYLLDIARDLVLNRRDTYPNIKDKVMFLQKMVAFEKQGDHLFNGYLELIHDIYTEPSLRRSDLTARLEPAFLVGCRARDPSLRSKFIDLLDNNLPRSPFSRLSYILGVQSWEALADQSWIYLALHLLLGTIDGEGSLFANRKTSAPPLLSARFTQTGHILKSMQQLLYADRQAAHDIWVAVFPSVWSCLSRREQVEITHHMINILSRDSHIKQAQLRPNAVHTLLTGVLACTPPLILPPHLVKYLAKTYSAWYVGLELTQKCLDEVRDEDSAIQESVKDSLAEIYAELAEDDMFYGLWRRRGLCDESNVAIAFEQNGMWDLAATVYEQGLNKIKAASGSYIEQEYCLWEDHWILAQEKLQQWDILYDLARSEGNQELMLESAWRIKDWSENRETMEETLANLSESAATPRRRVFELFLAAMRGQPNSNTPSNKEEFTRLLEDAMQLSLRKWISLPPQLSYAHVPLLQHFQQFVELHEAGQIFSSLATTTAQNLEKKSSDLKLILQAWRERLPGPCDDISVWSDLVAWRQNVFQCINKAYVPLVPTPPPNQNPANATNSQNTSGYRGYHETAWIVNRFAQVARRHGLLDVCFTSLARIYTLPNIEISEAFLKLREQARCHYQKGSELNAGLDVINNTNLLYFTQAQKAEFLTLKGMFHAALERAEDANEAFSQAVQMDMGQAKAWAEWGKFSDRMFKEHPEDMSHAANAVSCYLQAAGLYKSGKSRAMLTRVLWLLSIDDQNLTVSRAFDTYKGEAAFWYWISLIPQLCLSISHREVKQARYILLNIAKLYPQALFFHLRTTREDFALVKRQAYIAATTRRASTSGGPEASNSSANSSPEVKREDLHNHGNGGASNGPAFINPSVPGSILTDPTQLYAQRQSWDYVEEIVQILKTAFPLLIMTMETMVDQINQKFKSSAEEEIYRLTSMLLQEAMMSYIHRIKDVVDSGELSENSVSNVAKMIPNISPLYRAEFEETFIKKKPTLMEYIRGLQNWRDRHEKKLDSRPRMQSLDLLSHYLVEFQYSKFDEIEVPGQYTEDKDNNHGFVKILKFGPKFENCRSHGYSWKRFTLHGVDGSTTSFSVQLPSGRHTRKEEKVMQMFRSFNEVLKRKKESRKRNLTFHLSLSITCSSSLRLLQNDSSYVNFGDIYDQHCDSIHAKREDPILHVGDKTRIVLRDFQQTHKRIPDRTEYLNLKKQAMDDVGIKIIPEDVLTRYMIRTMHGPDELWRMRKQFALQIAAASFLTYVMTLHSRVPSRFHWSRQTGKIYMSELLPAPTAASEEVPFRLTPNMQHFLGSISTEGVLVSGMFAIARSLTENQFDMDHQLYLFARDEVLTFIHSKGKPWTFDLSFRQHVAQYAENVTKKAEIMACKMEREAVEKHGALTGPQPIVQTLLNLVSTATNPLALIRMGEHFQPWF